MSDRGSEPLDATLAQVVYRELYQRLADALRENASGDPLVEEIITALDEPSDINRLFVQRTTWWDRHIGSKQPAANIATSMCALICFDVIRRSDMAPEVAVEYLFDQIRKNHVAVTRGFVPAEEWQTPSAHWLTAEVVGLASTILFKLRLDSVERSNSPSGD